MAFQKQEPATSIAEKVARFGKLRRGYTLVVNRNLLDENGVPSVLDIYAEDGGAQPNQWPHFKEQGYEVLNAEEHKVAGEPAGVKTAKPAGK